SPPFVSSPPPFRNLGNHPHTKVASPHHLTHPQVASPHHLTHPQVTSPHPQVASPHHLTHPQVTSPHHFTHPQVTSAHHLPPPQVTSPHFVPQSQAPPSYPLHQAHVTTPHHLPYSPHTHLPPQRQLSDPGLDHQNWTTSEPPSDAACLNSFSYTCQNPATAHLDLQNQNQNQNQFNTGVNELGGTHRLPYNAHTLLGGGVYGQGQDTWGALEPALSQMQCSPLGSQSGGAGLGRWNSVDFNSSSTEDFSNAQFFPDSYHDNSTPQSFCSPTTPGPSPHHPTPRPSPAPLPPSSEPGQHHPHQTSRRPLLSQTEPIQDQTNIFSSGGGGLESSFSSQGGGQNVSAAAQSPGLAAGPVWREECGGGGGGGGGGGDGQPDWTWVKRPQPANSTKPLDCRLLCTVCKRDFRSLPALNGHMRSHSGVRSTPWVKKGDEPSPPAQPSVSVSMVMPVSVPIQSRGASKACRSGQRRFSHVPAATRGAVLYRSLMRLEDEEEVVDEGETVVRGDGGRGHYTPPPMLCPLRVGAGLYCSLTSRRQHRVETVQLHNTHNGVSDLVAMETLTTGINKPRINVGRGFQAEIPPLRHHKHVHSNSQNALLVWMPWEELENPVNQQRVEALLTMARSSVVPGGGASAEHALHVLSECRGDFLLTVEKLLSSPEASDNHTGVSWSAAEMKLLVKSLQLHQKDFSSVQKTVRTKSLSQCVEFYYLWKKKLGLSVRTPAGLTVTLPEHKSTPSQTENQNQTEDQNQTENQNQTEDQNQTESQNQTENQNQTESQNQTEDQNQNQNQTRLLNKQTNKPEEKKKKKSLQLWRSWCVTAGSCQISVNLVVH
ncbi:hypothetical protein INR49_022002, partial [Caranx melampygus]